MLNAFENPTLQLVLVLLLFFMSDVGLSNMYWHNIPLEQNNDLLC